MAGDLHVISREGHCGGQLFGVLPIFTCPLDGSSFHACFRVWPCHGPPFLRAGEEWNYDNHISVVELKSIGQLVFTDTRLTDRLKQIFFDELAFARCPLTHCHVGEFQARVAIGGPHYRNSKVYSAISRVTDHHCIVRLIGRILRNVFMLLSDHGHIPLNVDMHTVTLHMQFHERARPPFSQRARLEALKHSFDLMKLPMQGAAAVPSPPATPMPTRPCPNWDPWGPDLVPRPRTAADLGHMD